SAGEKGAAINNLAAIISSARSGMVDSGMKMVGDVWNSVKPNQVTLLNFTYDFDDNRMDLNMLPGISVGRSYGQTEGKYSVSAGFTYKYMGLGGSQSLSNIKSASGGWSVGIDFPVNLTMRGRRWSN
ncbi:hypothetical protein EB093_08380, partial [bacterium]|nr:hypothetical protein [bacterium]